MAALALLRKPDRILRHCCRMLETDLTQTEILLEQAGLISVPSLAFDWK